MMTPNQGSSSIQIEFLQFLVSVCVREWLGRLLLLGKRAYESAADRRRPTGTCIDGWQLGGPVPSYAPPGTPKLA